MKSSAGGWRSAAIKVSLRIRARQCTFSSSVYFWMIYGGRTYGNHCMLYAHIPATAGSYNLKLSTLSAGVYANLPAGWRTSTQKAGWEDALRDGQGL
jgi:hypothetical protein